MCHRNGTTADENIVDVWNGLGVDGDGGEGVTLDHSIYNFFNLKKLTHAPRHLGMSLNKKYSFNLGIFQTRSDPPLPGFWNFWGTFPLANFFPKLLGHFLCHTSTIIWGKKVPKNFCSCSRRHLSSCDPIFQSVQLGSSADEFCATKMAIIA